MSELDNYLDDTERGDPMGMLREYDDVDAMVIDPTRRSASADRDTRRSTYTRTRTHISTRTHTHTHIRTRTRIDPSAAQAAARYLHLVAKRYAEGDKWTNEQDVEKAYREWFAASRVSG